MPKISKYSFQLETPSIKERFEVDIYYSSSEGFYSLLPGQFNELFDSAFDALQAKGARKQYKSKYHQYNEQYKRVVVGTSESEVKNNLRAVLSQLVECQVIRRPVIVLLYDGDNRCTYGSMSYNDQHAQIGLRLGLLYCTEVRAGEASQPRYYTFQEYKAFGEKRVDKTEVHLYNRECTIIDDTPGNRATLEHIYTAIQKLIEKLDEYTTSPDALLRLIQSKQKLLN